MEFEGKDYLHQNLTSHAPKSTDKHFQSKHNSTQFHANFFSRLNFAWESWQVRFLWDYIALNILTTSLTMQAISFEQIIINEGISKKS